MTGRSGANPVASRACPCEGLSPSLHIVLYVFGLSGVFDLHVSEFLRIEDLATFQALDELRVFVPGDDANSRVSARGCHWSWESLN